MADEGAGARQLGETARGAWADVTARLADDPYPVLGAALGVGYVLGGGLFSPLTRPLWRAAMGLLLLPKAREPIARAADSVRSALFAQPQAQA